MVPDVLGLAPGEWRLAPEVLMSGPGVMRSAPDDLGMALDVF